MSADAGGPVVLWDFDGTLAERPGMWSGCVLEALDADGPGHGMTIEQIRAGLRDGFPWHVAHEPHPHLCEPEAWWDEIGVLLAAAAGVAPERAVALARAARARYVDPACWRVFDDTLPALRALREAGWRNVVLSNHVPELPQLVEALGIAPHVDAVFTSATTGYEKPHPEAFRIALRALGEPERVWMIGDNPVADVEGAAGVGLPAILVRRAGHAEARTLAEAVELVLGD